MTALTDTAALTDTDVRALRMRALLLAGDRPHESVAEVVTWMGAMQAQDLASGLWSLGIRLPGRTHVDVTDALERREALRTWPMRGTVHLVPTRDARWMLELMSAKPLAGAAGRREALGITTEMVDRTLSSLGGALQGGKRLTRAECLAVVADAGVTISGQVGYHLLWYAAQLGLTCLAPHVGKEQTFVLLDEWAPDQVALDREEALATIAARYFRGHGPATVKDLARWTGLGIKDCRAGVASAGSTLREVDTESGPMVASAQALDAGVPTDAGGHVMPPGFDEYMLGYGDRSLLMPAERLADVVPGSNGVFRATLVRDGRVVGTWKRTVRAKSVVVDAVPFGTLGVRDRASFERAFARYGTFVGQTADVRWAPR